MKKSILFLLIAVSAAACKTANRADDKSGRTAAPEPGPPVFTVIHEIPALPVTSQISGTCWAFSTASFLESEIYRTKGRLVRLSAMYFVRNAYLGKAQNFILRQGTARFTEGGCNYDPVADMEKYGLMPYEAYSGLACGVTPGDHGKLIRELAPLVGELADPANKRSAAWRSEVRALLDSHMGLPADTFSYAGAAFTAAGFLEFTGLKASDYVNLTSFTHAPADRYFILEIPANWTNMRYFNVALDEYMENIDNALENGYSLAVDMDLSEPGLSWIADMEPGIGITSEKRQSDFESFATTDDHNMHLVGKVKDGGGNIYYKCKNSWGNSFGADGHYYLSERYVRAKSIYVMLHRDGLKESTRKKLQDG